MNIPLIGGDKIRSLIKNATKDSSTGSNESLMKTNTRDSNNMIKDSDQLEMDRKNKIIMNNLKKSGGIVNKTQGLIGDLKKSEPKNIGGGINVSKGGNFNDSEIKSRGIEVNNIENENINNNIEGIRINKNNGVLTNQSNGRINGGGGWGGIENETIGDSKRMSQAVVDLYKVAGRLNEREEELNIDKLRNSFEELDGLSDEVLGDLVEDLKIMNKDGDEDLFKIIEAYPELGKVRLDDLNDASKAELLGGLVDGNDEKWGLVDWVLWQPNLLSKALGGEKLTDYFSDFADWAYDNKKMIKYTQKDEGEFLKDLHKKYAEYTNENGEWLPNATPEIKKQYKKEWDEYESKATLNNVGNSIGNFFKGLPKVVDTALNIANHPGDLIKTLPRLVAGLPATGTEWVAEKIEEKTGNNFLDKLAQRKGYDTWQEIKEAMYDKAANGKGVFNKVATWVFSSSEVSDAMKDYIVDSYGSEEKFLQTLVERPEDVISDAISVAEGTVGIAKGAGLIDAARAEMIIKNLGYFDMYEMSTKGAFQAEKWLAKNQLKLAEKGIGKTMKGMEKAGGLLKNSPVGKMVSFVENKLTGLSEEERKFIRENGDIVEEYLKGNRSADDIAEMILSKFDDLTEGKKAVGQFYDFIKNNEKLTVKTSGIVSGIKEILKELGIKTDSKGNLKFSELSYTPSQQKQLQQVYNYVKALENLGDSATAKDVWRARQLIDSLINWEGNTKMGLDAEVMNSIRNMRSKVDDALKEQVKGFKEADAEYKNLTSLVKELKKDWFTKDGKLKDNALSKIRNLTNKGNEAKLERLEKQFPGITRALKGLGVSQSIEKASKMMVGQYAQQLLIGGGLWKLINGDLSVATALIGAGILTPKNLVKILKKEGDFMSKWKSVADNLSSGKVLSDEKLNRLRKWLKNNSQDIGERVLEEEGGKGWEKVDMDKVDLEYDKAQREAYVGGKSTEKKLTKEERASLLKKYAKGSENNGFVMKIVDNMGEGTHGMADLDRKLVKLEENFGDTTAQHEFFHELFSVIDEDTKKYVINEVKNYLDLSDDVAAEEWLAESFGIYARRKEIKLGNIRLKGNRLQRFQSKLRDLFQRAYEWIQNYSMDRKTINKLFNEVYGAVDGKVLDESGKFDLAEKLGINEKSRKLGGLDDGKGLRYKKGGNLGKNDYKETAVKAQHDGLGEKTPLTAVRGQNFNDSGLFGGNKDSKGHYIIKGGREKQVIYTKINNGKAKFSGYKMDLQEKNRKYYDNVVNALNRFEKRGYNGKDILIGKTPRGNDIFITDKDLVHIFKEHGEFYIENLIESVNNGRDGFWEIESNKNYNGVGLRPRMEIEIPGKNEKFIVGLMSDGSDEFNSTRYNVKSLRESKPSQVESRGGVRFKKDEKGLDVKDKQDGKIRYKRVRHGSPTEFKKFDSSHMGEGEGAQAHGWGHYVAVDEKTGRKYAEMEKLANMKLDGRGLEDWINDYKKKGGDDPKLYARAEVAKRLEMGDGLATAKSMAKYDAEEFLKSIQGTETELDGKKFMHTPRGLYPKDAWDKAVKMYEDKIKAIDEITKDMWNRGVEGNRNLYEVEIPDPVKKDTPTGSNYLEEGGRNDNPGWKEGRIQPEQVDKFVNALKNYDEVAGQKLADRMYFKGDVAPVMDGRGMYKEISGVLGGDEEASKFLSKIGYDGIHYFGGMDGESYVIFNDDSAKIENHIRYKKDNTGKELSQAQQDYFKDSKVRDANGKLLRMYHGTPDKGFTVFKEGYFTPNKEYADKYQSTTASSIKFNKKGANPGTYEVYLNIKNPFDTRDAKAREIFEKEYFGNYGMGTQLGEKGLPDWMDGTDLQEFLMEKHPEYDGLILDEGGTFIPNTSKYENDFYGGEVQDRGLSYVPFESNQIKNVDNLNPTKSEDIRYKKDANEGQGLIAIHNTSMEKLAKSKNLGGIVAPSVAITKEGVPFENYGEISFIGNKDLVKPGKNTVVGETDLYSPRVPKPTLERKDGVTREMRDEFAEKMGMREAELESYLFEGGGTYYERTYPKLAEEIEPLITKKLFKGFTDMGDRIYEPYNMKNIIKEMFSEGDVGAESSMFQGSLSEAMARMSDEVTDFEKVRGKIVDGGYDMKKLDEKYDKLSDKYMNYGWDVLEGREGMGIFSENIKRSNSAIVAELADYGIEVTEKQVQKLKDMVKEGLDLPKGYVEAKIKRGVGFDEFSAVVVPEDKVAEVKKLIDNPNIEVYGYKEGERMKVIQEVAKKNNLRFKKGLNKKLGSVGVMNSKGNIGGLSRKGLGTMAKGLRYKQQQDLKN